jgi:serum/glucocorticoid-regulated kinase 2
MDEWVPVQGGSGHVHIQVSFKPAQVSLFASIVDQADIRHPSPSTRLSYSKSLEKDHSERQVHPQVQANNQVMQVRKRDTLRIYALKTIRKAHIVSRSEVTHTLAERTVLAKVNCPFIVPLKFSFQSTEKLYLVLAFVNGGELFHHLQREGKFNETRSRFYAAELLMALEHLHGFNVVYRYVPLIIVMARANDRDLKPENILLDYTGHIALCDFGLCKLNMSNEDTTNSTSTSRLC